MKVVNVPQGSTEWLELRAKYDTASEAPAMAGVSLYTTREDFLKLKKTGIAPEIDAHKQAIFDKGHAAEAAIRPHIEKEIGAELFPATGTLEINGLALLASFDGITMLEDIVFEHKLFGAKLAAATRKGKLDPHYCFQLEQQLLVSGAEKAIFVTSDGTPDNMEYCWYVSDPKIRKALLAGWHQFAKDLEAYEPAPEEVKPETNAIMELPALDIQISGEVKSTNLVTYKKSMVAFIQSINTDLQTDEDFAQAELQVKFCSKAEKHLDIVKQQALSQTATIDELFRTVDQLKEVMRTKRLALEKLVKLKKEMIRIEIVTETKAKFADHLTGLNSSLDGDYMPGIIAEFASAMKGKKTVASLRNAVNDEMARVKIEANEIAEKIRSNLKVLTDTADKYRFLFSDLKQIILKDGDDFALLVKSRVDDHIKAEEEKLEKERERIREEEEKKAKAKAMAAKPPESPDETETPAPVESSNTAAAPVSETTKQAPLTDYQRGYIAALKEYAHREDGVEYIGPRGTTLKHAIDDFLREEAA